jgi:hypothetical protein
MTLVKNILHDLVEKRLWPVALLLCGALIAVPVVLKKDPAPPASSASGPSTAELADAASVVALDDPSRTRLNVGDPRNPFSPNKPPAARTSGDKGDDTPSSSTPTGGGEAGTTEGAAGGGGGGGGGGAVPDGGSTDGGTGGGTTPIPDPPAPGTMAWTLDVKFGKDGDTKPLKSLAPGRALPSSSDPLLIYLAAVNGGKGARFLVSSDARPQGDGKCEPSAKACTEITLMDGDTAFFDVAKGDETVQYELELTNVEKRVVE